MLLLNVKKKKKNYIKLTLKKGLQHESKIALKKKLLLFN